MTAYQINHAGHLVYKNNSVVYQNVDFGFLCVISFCVTCAVYSRPAPLTRDPRCRPETRDWQPALNRHSQDFLPCILGPSHVRVRRVLFYLKLFRLLYDLEVAAQSE